jgi:hypothetical protein
MNLYKTEFHDNIAYRGGAIAIDTSSYLYAKQVVFDSNIAYLSGGVMYVSTQSYFDA